MSHANGDRRSASSKQKLNSPLLFRFKMTSPSEVPIHSFGSAVNILEFLWGWCLKTGAQIQIFLLSSWWFRVLVPHS